MYVRNIFVYCTVMQALLKYNCISTILYLNHCSKKHLSLLKTNNQSKYNNVFVMHITLAIICIYRVFVNNINKLILFLVLIK